MIGKLVKPRQALNSLDAEPLAVRSIAISVSPFQLTDGVPTCGARASSVSRGLTTKPGGGLASVEFQR